MSNSELTDRRESDSKSITQEDITNLPLIQEMIEEDIEYAQAMLKYAQENYDEECQLYADECPDNTDIPEDLYYKQIYLWFITEKKLPSKGRTVLEEFVQKYVTPKDQNAANRLLLSKNMIRGSFKVLDVTNYPYVLVEHMETKTRYLVVSKIPPSPGAKKTFILGGIINGKIHAWWGNKYYMFDGILTREPTREEISSQLGFIVDPEVLMERYEQDQATRFESILINFNTTLKSAMHKYPSQWVDGMCSAIGINIKEVRTKSAKINALVSKLEHGHAEHLLREECTKEQITALEMLYWNDWILKYGQLTKRFSTETSFWWKEYPPKSEIGILRLLGFIVVGKFPNGGRYYKVASVPVEMRPFVKAFLSSRTG